MPKQTKLIFGMRVTMENSYSVLDKDPDLPSVKAYIYSTCKKLTSIKSTITKHLTTLRLVISVVSELSFLSYCQKCNIHSGEKLHSHH